VGYKKGEGNILGGIYGDLTAVNHVIEKTDQHGFPPVLAAFPVYTRNNIIADTTQ
jgi:hypothetical protein